MKYRRSIKSDSFLVTMDVCSLYTNIPHDEGIMYNLHALIQFYGDLRPLPAKYLQQMFVFILKHQAKQKGITCFGWDKFDMASLIGAGSYRQVFCCVYNKEHVVVKLLGEANEDEW